MSKHKAFTPGTYVPGYRVHRNPDGSVMLNTTPGPDFGKPVVTYAKPIAHLLHFANAAARRRTCAAIGCSPTDDEAIRLGVPVHARPRDLVKVPLLRGLPCRLANEIRADMRRKAAGKKVV